VWESFLLETSRDINELINEETNDSGNGTSLLQEFCKRNLE
jgi:hypothetical protein